MDKIQVHIATRKKELDALAALLPILMPNYLDLQLYAASNLFIYNRGFIHIHQTNVNKELTISFISTFEVQKTDSLIML